MADFDKAREHLAALEALEQDNLTGEINVGVRALREKITDIIETEERRVALGLKIFCVTFQYHRTMYQEIEIEARDVAHAIEIAEPDDEDWKEFDDCGETYVGKVEEFESGEFRDRPIPPKDREEYLCIVKKDIPAHEVAVRALALLRKIVVGDGRMSAGMVDTGKELIESADKIAQEIGS